MWTLDLETNQDIGDVELLMDVVTIIILLAL